MECMEFGKIKFIQGQNNGRFPFCNSLLIEDDVNVIIDPGAGLDLMRQIRGDDHLHRWQIFEEKPLKNGFAADDLIRTCFCRKGAEGNRLKAAPLEDEAALFSKI